MSIARKIADYDDAYVFLKEVLEMGSLIKSRPELFKKLGRDEETIINRMIKDVTSAEIKDRSFHRDNTLTSQRNRLSYKTNEEREKLRNLISVELLGKKRLDNDDKITLGKGGDAS